MRTEFWTISFGSDKMCCPLRVVLKPQKNSSEIVL